MTVNTMTTGAAQGNTVAAGGDGSTTATGAAGANGSQNAAPQANGQGQGAGGTVLGTTAFANQGNADPGQQQTPPTDGGQNGQNGQDGKDGETDQETKPEAVIPENAAAYTFEAPADIPVNDALLGKVKDIAFAGKLSQEQFAAIVPELLKVDAGRFDALKQAYARQRAEGITALQTEWGQEFPANVALAQKAVKTFGSPELGALFESTGIGDHPLIVKTFHLIGKALSEDGAFGKGGGGGNAGQNAASILYPKMNFKN
jgi:hypothetical protein